MVICFIAEDVKGTFVGDSGMTVAILDAVDKCSGYFDVKGSEEIDKTVCAANVSRYLEVD